MLVFQNGSSEELMETFEPGINKITHWRDDLIEMMPNIILAVLALIVFYFISRFFRKMITRYFGRFTHNKSATNIIALLFSSLIMLAGIMIALSFLKLDKALTGFLAGAGIVGVALGFAFQDTAANFIAGTFMAFRNNFRVGDLIETNDITAVVENIDLRSTKLKTLDGSRIIIPNKEIFQSKLTNYNTYSTRRVDLKCSVDYESNLDQVEEVTLTVIKGIDAIRSTPSPEFYFTEFGDSAIHFEVRFWVDFLRVPDYYDAKHLAIKGIRKKFAEENIKIPFPIRTLDVRENTSFTLSSEKK